MAEILLAKITSVDVRREGTRVLVLHNGRLLFDLEYDAALALAKALHIQGKKAEEEVHALDIIADQAILTRLGVPVGLTSRPDMLKKACNEAAWNSDLRRRIPPARAGGIASQAVFGTPTIIAQHPREGTKHPPKET